MRVGIYGKDITDQTVGEIRDVMDQHGIESLPIPMRSRVRNVDCMVVLGGDRGMRVYFHGTADPTVPVLGIGEAETGGFLAQADSDGISTHMGRLKRGDYSIEEVPRLGVEIDGRSIHPVLNDVAVFPSKSAILMEYTLSVDGEEVWHDNSDGVIVSTPIGSSAYSMSAGGPMIFHKSAVFGIISVNSLDITRRPLIVSDRSQIDIGDVASRLHCEAVMDGIERHVVKESVHCVRSASPARIIRMKKDSTTISALTKKVHLTEELLGMPPSAKLLLKTLEYEGQLTQREMASKTLLPERTIRLALSHLLEKGYIKRKVSVRDARQRTSS